MPKKAVNLYVTEDIATKLYKASDELGVSNSVLVTLMANLYIMDGHMMLPNEVAYDFMSKVSEWLTEPRKT